MKRACALVLTLFTALSVLCACSRQEGVPTELAFGLVEPCKYSDSAYWITQSVEHQYDARSHMDSATLITCAEWNYGSYISTCNASFLYDKSSDLWSLLRAEKWSQPVYTFNDNLVGRWEVGSTLGTPDDRYVVEILEVMDTAVSLNYQITDTVYGGLFSGDVLLEAAGSATVSYENDILWVPVTLPEGFYAGGGKKSTKLCIFLDIGQGVKSAYISDQLAYVE